MENEHAVSHSVYTETAPLADAPDRLLNKAELAAFCGVRTRTIENWMRLGLPYFKIKRTVRFKLADVMTYQLSASAMPATTA
jgi:phage terminase Nu1 subunit (DNA packaging protein)